MIRKKIKEFRFDEGENFRGTVEYELDFSPCVPQVMWYEVTRDNTTKKFLTEEQHTRIMELIEDNERKTN